MNILCFASGSALLKKVSTAVIDLNAPGVAVELFKSFDSLYLRLCQPADSNRVLVLCPGNRREMDEIMSMQEILSGMKFILVLPRRNEEYLKAAHLLFPRFIVFSDENFAPLTMVLKKMSSSFARKAEERDRAAQPVNSSKKKGGMHEKAAHRRSR